MSPNRQRACDIILEILRQAGGEMPKTLLYKAFWLAHLYYAKTSPGFLSDWPIVRMPFGPGIDQGDSLLVDLLDEGQVAAQHVAKGPFVETRFFLPKPLDAENRLPPEAVDAIRAGVDDVKGQHAK